MKVKITKELNVEASGNLKVGTVHETIPTPEVYEHLRNKDGFWVMGEGQPVRLFPHEVEVVDNSDPSHPAYQVKVIPLDIEKINKEVTKHLQKKEQYKDMNFEVKEKLAIVVGTNFYTDKEAVHYDGLNERGIDFDVYRASETKVVDGKKTVTGFYMFPVCGITLQPEDIDRFKLPEVTLPEFMADRFQYNSRIKSNISLLLKSANVK